MKKCLFVIDVQESFRYRDYFDASQLPAFLAQQNALITACEAAGVPIVRVFHTDSEGVFALESGKVIPLQGLTDFHEALCVYKKRHSALIGTELPIWLTQHHIEEIIISGIRTEQCCETTARHAADCGYRVTYALDATLTFAMQAPNGEPLTADAIKRHTQTVLQDRFANVVDTQTAIANL